MDIVTMGALMGKIKGAKAEMKNSMDALKSAMSVEKTVESDRYASYLEIANAIGGIPSGLMIEIPPAHTENVYNGRYWAAGAGKNLMTPIKNAIPVNGTTIGGAQVSWRPDGSIRVYRANTGYSDVTYALATYNYYNQDEIYSSFILPSGDFGFWDMGSSQNDRLCYLAIQIKQSGEPHLLNASGGPLVYQFQHNAIDDVYITLRIEKSFRGEMILKPMLVAGSDSPTSYEPAEYMTDFKTLGALGLLITDGDYNHYYEYDDFYSYQPRALALNFVDLQGDNPMIRATKFCNLQTANVGIDGADWTEDTTGNGCFRHNSSLPFMKPAADIPAAKRPYLYLCDRASYNEDPTHPYGSYFGVDAQGLFFNKISAEDTAEAFLHRMGRINQKTGTRVSFILPLKAGDMHYHGIAERVPELFNGYNEISLLNQGEPINTYTSVAYAASALADLEARVAALEAANNT